MRRFLKNRYRLVYKVFIVSMFTILGICNLHSFSLDQSPILASDEFEFCERLNESIKQSVPIIISEDETNEGFNHFLNQYQSNADENLDSDEEALVIQPVINAEQIVVAKIDDKRILAMAAHMSCLYDLPLFICSDSSSQKCQDLLYGNKKSIYIGEHEIGSKGDSFATYDEVKNLYDRCLASSQLTVYIESESLYVSGLYLASLRGGKLCFDIDEYVTTEQSQYFAWVVSQKDFNATKLENIQKQLDLNHDECMDISLGIITGKNAQQANLLVVRSYYYPRMNPEKHVTAVDVLNRDDYSSELYGDWSYTRVGGRSADKETIKELFAESSYIKLYGHGSPTSFKIDDRSSLKGTDIPLLNSPIVIFEACYTGKFDVVNSIALDIIEKGAVAFIGSVKNGGVTNPNIECVGSHFYTTQDVRIGDFVTYHNLGIKNSIENYERAILIGDPMWHAFKTVGTLNKNQYSFELPAHTLFDSIVPIKVSSKLKIKGFDMWQSNANRVVFAECLGDEVAFDLEKGPSIVRLLKKVLKQIYISYSFVFQELFSVDLILVAIIAIVFLVLKYGSEKYVSLERFDLVILSMSLLLFYCFEHFVIQIDFQIFKYITLSSIFYIVIKSKGSFKILLGIEGILFVLFGLVLHFFNVETSMYYILGVGVTTFVVVTGLIVNGMCILTLKMRTLIYNNSPFKDA